MCILLNIDIEFVYVDNSGSVLSLLALVVIEGIWSFRHWFYILYVFLCLKHCVALLRLSNPPRILLTKIFLSSIILHIMLILIQIRRSMVVWHHLLLESIYKLLMSRLFLGVSIWNFWWRVDCWSFPWIIKIEVFNKLFYSFSNFFRIHPDKTVFQDLLSKIDQNLTLIKREFLVQCIVLMVEVKKVLEMLPEMWVNLMFLTEVKLVCLALHHFIYCFMLLFA